MWKWVKHHWNIYQCMCSLSRQTGYYLALQLVHHWKRCISATHSLALIRAHLKMWTVSFCPTEYRMNTLMLFHTTWLYLIFLAHCDQQTLSNSCGTWSVFQWNPSLEQCELRKTGRKNNQCGRKNALESCSFNYDFVLVCIFSRNVVYFGCLAPASRLSWVVSSVSKVETGAHADIR